MNDISMEERIAIKDSARSLKKYGSTSSNSKRCESFIKHQVVQSDTLQGLALKYGVTTEQIRRANTLWANDSLFLRKFLLIPIASGPSSNGGLDSSISSMQTTDSHQLCNNNNNNNNIQRSEASCSREESPSQSAEEENYNDFLVKIDCAIASTKSQIMITQDNSHFVEDDSIFWRRKGAQSRLKQQQRHHKEDTIESTTNHHQQTIEPERSSISSTNTDTSDVPATAIVMTQGRKVRNSLQRLEKQQNDIFEL